MSTTGGYQEDSGELRAHAVTVGRLAGRVDTAAGAVRTTLDSNAFGYVCQFLVPQVVAMGEITRAAVVGAGLSVDAVQLGLRATAEVYDRVEDDNATIFEGGR